MNATGLFFASLIAAFVFSMFAMISVMGESFVDYTVVNETNEPLFTWYQEEGCSHEIRYRNDLVSLSGEVRVAPHDRLNYSTSTQSTGCIRVITKDRLPLVVEKYHDNAVITISEPTGPLSLEPLPLATDLPEEPFGLRSVIDNIGWGRLVILMVSAIAWLVCLASGVWILVRSLGQLFVRLLHAKG